MTAASARARETAFRGIDGAVSFAPAPLPSITILLLSIGSLRLPARDWVM